MMCTNCVRTHVDGRTIDGVSVERTEYGTYRARWRDANGRQRAKTFTRKVDAKQFLDATLTDLRRGEYVAPDASRLTVGQWADEWLAGAMNLGQGGRDTYRRDLDRYILPVLRRVPLGKLTDSVIDRFLSDELDDLGPSTVHRHYRTIRRMCQVAVDKGRLAKNPCDAVTPPPIEHGEMRFLTIAQVDALADAIGDRYRGWVYVAAYGGLRWSETVGLRRSHVDGTRITVTEQLVKRADGQWHRDKPKSKAGRRAITLPAFVAEVVQHHLDTYTAGGADALVFANRAGNPMAHSNFTGMVFKPALERAGIDRATRVHDLRHSAVALAIQAGAHPKAIQVRMGHASISVTLDRYGHLYSDIDEALAVRLDELARPPVEEAA